MSTRISFLGAAGTVTGSRHLLDNGRAKMLVDCGLFQGLKALRKRNRLPFPVSPRELDAVVLTHAHIDHSGYLPLLVKNGFRGRIWCTRATRDLCRILLPDSGHLQEEEAEFANRHGTSKHRPALPLYTAQDAIDSLEYLEAVDYHERFSPADGFEATFHDAGHILGSAWVSVEDGARRIVFSGDVGRPHAPIMPAPEVIEAADYLITESTYGDRRHETEDPAELIAEVVARTAARGGTIVVPSFAVGRAQSVLYLLTQLIHKGRVPRLPVFLDSPMAIDVTELYMRYSRQHRLTRADCDLMSDLVTTTPTVDESKAINSVAGPKVIVSASGMATGGRVLHHLIHYAPERHNAILLVGYQAAGTRGASIEAGAEHVKIFGKYVPIRAQVSRLRSLSAHADYVELGDWLGKINKPPRQTFIVHGEPAAADALRCWLAHRLGWDPAIPEMGESFTLD